MITLKTMLTASALLLAAEAGAQTPTQTQAAPIDKQQPTLTSDRMTPEALWAMGRIGSVNLAPNGKEAVYAVSYYSVKENKSRSVLYTLSLIHI